MLTATPFGAQVRRESGRVLCALSGTLTYDSYPRFRPLLEAVDEDADVVLDLGDLHFLDSNGLGMLLVLKDRVSGTGRALDLVNVPPRIERVLERTDARVLLGR